MRHPKLTAPQVKICGITRIDDALACVRHGADALGFVFYTKSPRHVSGETVREIARRLPPRIGKIGVFVNASFDEITAKVRTCGLTGVQLHGQEAPDLVRRLMEEEIIVIKALFSAASPRMTDVFRYGAHAYLVECGKGVLPGGNALAWNWSESRTVGANHPLILAGGLTPENVGRALSDARPDAVDVSSGVERRPGMKEAKKVAAFVGEVRRWRLSELRVVF